jgi:small membrane protein
MIILLQSLVILVALVVIYFAISSRRSHTASAWKKILLCLLAVAMVAAVLVPELTNKIANMVGVGRGADLLLYGVTLGFITFALNSYISQQSERDALYRLARKIALVEAEERYKLEIRKKELK